MRTVSCVEATGKPPWEAKFHVPGNFFFSAPTTVKAGAAFMVEWTEAEGALSYQVTTGGLAEQGTLDGRIFRATAPATPGKVSLHVTAVGRGFPVVLATHSRSVTFDVVP